MDDKLNNVKKEFDAFDHDLDEAMRRGNIFEKIFHSARLKFWLSVIDYSGKKVLDVGCNTGILLIPLRKRQVEVFGVDISKRDVLRVKEKLKECALSADCVQVSDATKLPFSPNIFDVIILSDILEHVSNPKKAAQEAMRVVKPGGLVLVSVPNSWHPVVKFAWVRKLFTGRKDVDEHLDVPYTYGKLEELFPDAIVVKKKLVGFMSEIFCIFQKKLS